VAVPFTPRNPSAVSMSASTSRSAVTGLEARYSASNSPRETDMAFVGTLFEPLVADAEGS
jgi:hypothetical protein